MHGKALFDSFVLWIIKFAILKKNLGMSSLLHIKKKKKKIWILQSFKMSFNYRTKAFLLKIFFFHSEANFPEFKL